ncbi:MAG TPA: hypothetical protein VK909_04680, partial [Anaerolineales bacterium]|nr:hypothetical protein [Anaerolineales bacterium]
MNTLGRFLTISSTDPDDARRRRLLNILLLGVLVAALLGLVTVIFISISQGFRLTSEIQVILAGTLIFTIGIFGIYQLNRRHSGRLAGLLFLLLLTIIFIFTDSPEELVKGRSLFLFTIPIAISSLILIPQASFFFAGISSLIISVLATSIGLNANIFVISGFFLLALVSWLSARSLEQALSDLRHINTNLYIVVTERNQALAESLERDRIEAGRNQAMLYYFADGVFVLDRQWNATM